ncbi:MAG TPA: hypothetical protein VGV68_15555 [Terriglobia bacterium]|nr:hypothetical protein [Terriglobia bacterium]
MPSSRDPDLLLALQQELETFIHALRHPIVVEDEVELFDLTAARWKLTVEFGKLLFEAWNTTRSIARRVEGVAYRDRGRIGIFARKPGGRDTGTLEFRDLEQTEKAGRARGADRTRFRKEFINLLEREYSGWSFERVSNRSDLAHSFSTWYTRGLARQGRTGWAFLGVAESEFPAAMDSVLAHGLIWLDWLRAQSPHATVAGLKLFIPPAAVRLSAHRAACLNNRAVQVEILEWKPGNVRPVSIDIKDFGNVETRLLPRRQGELLVETHRPLLQEWVGDSLDQMDLVADSSGNFTSLRARGLEVARVEGQITPQIYFGLEGSYRKLDEANGGEFRRFLKQVLQVRDARSRDKSHEYYRLQSERWLESLLLRDITKIDSELLPECVYPQVPAFSATDRGIIDILGVTRRGRLAVIELKVHEEINLPVQGLDYWLRVKWLQDRGQFQERGYFQGVELSHAPPLLYLVCPAFRFHSSLERVIRYFDPSIEIIQVGLNDQWREGFQVLFRRTTRTPR